MKTSHSLIHSTLKTKKTQKQKREKKKTRRSRDLEEAGHAFLVGTGRVRGESESAGLFSQQDGARSRLAHLPLGGRTEVAAFHNLRDHFFLIWFCWMRSGGVVCLL